MRADDRSNRLSLAWLTAITVAATALRLRHLGTQILGDDEVHLLTVIATQPLGQIPGTVIGFDYPIPLAMLFRAWSSWMPLTEWMLRAPILIAGCLTPWLAARLAVRFVGPRVALALGWAVAVHPFFIFYSRFVRSYGICIALLLVMLYMLDRWRETGRLRDLLWPVFLSSLACWMQPLTLITVAMIFAGLLLREVVARRAGGGRPLAALLAGVGALGLTLLLYAPALAELVDQMMVEKVGVGVLNLAAVRRGAAMSAGLPGTLPAVVFLALVAVGVVRIARRERAAALLLLVPALIVPLIILLLRPLDFGNRLVLARYHFYVLPLWMLFATDALGGLTG